MIAKLAFLAASVVNATIVGAVTMPANAIQIEKADREVSKVRVTYVEPTHRSRLYVELNDGSTYSLMPCIYEDGSGPSKSEVQRGGCYWDANDRGNRVGTSFVVLPKGEFVASAKVGSAR